MLEITINGGSVCVRIDERTNVNCNELCYSDGSEIEFYARGGNSLKIRATRAVLVKLAERILAEADSVELVR